MGGYSTTGKCQHKEINRHLAEARERRAKKDANPIAADPVVASLTKDIQESEAEAGLDMKDLDVGARAKAAGRKDHIASLFQVPKMRPDSTAARDAHVDMSDHCKGVDKEF